MSPFTRSIRVHSEPTRVRVSCTSEVALRLAILTFDPFLNAAARTK